MPNLRNRSRQPSALDWNAFEDHWGRAQSPKPFEATQCAQRLFPDVPDDDFTTFLARAERLLSPEALPVVERAFSRARGETVRWIDQGGLADPEAWARHLRGLLDRASSRPEAVTLLRGAQTAFFLGGWWLRVDSRLLGLYWESKAKLALEDPLVSLLLRYPSPQYAAIGLVRALTGADLGSIAAIPVAAVDESGAWLECSDRRHSVPERAQGAIRAQLAARARAGAGPDDSFLVDGMSEGKPSRAPAPISPRGVQRVLRSISDEIGRELVPRKTSWRPEGDSSWARKLGLVLRPIELHSRG